jgi:DNA-binding response OmpR family regulator
VKQTLSNIGELDRFEREVAGRRVILIDDDPSQSTLLSSYFDKTEADFVSFTAPDAGLFALQNEDFDLAILDVMMPEIDGWELFSEIRAMERYEQLPVLFLTCLVNRFEEGRHSDLDRNCLTLAKPVEADRFKVAVVELLARE